jgi:hypothetical protein
MTGIEWALIIYFITVGGQVILNLEMLKDFSSQLQASGYKIDWEKLKKIYLSSCELHKCGGIRNNDMLKWIFSSFYPFSKTLKVSYNFPLFQDELFNILEDIKLLRRTNKTVNSAFKSNNTESDSSKVNGLIVNATTAKVSVYRDPDSENISLSEDIDIFKEYYDYYITGNTLFINQRVINSKKNLFLDIGIPNIPYHFIKLATVSGDVDIADLDTKQLDISTFSGNIDIFGVKAPSRLSSICGSIYATYYPPIRDYEFSTETFIGKVIRKPRNERRPISELNRKMKVKAMSIAGNIDINTL